MTSATDAQQVTDLPQIIDAQDGDGAPANPRFGGRRVRLALGFGFGVLGVFALAAGSFLAFEAQYQGRILPGVSVGSVDVSGLAPSEAAARIRQAYGSLADGELVLAAGGATESIAYAEVGRTVDAQKLAEAALAMGRTGNVLERVIGDVRMALNGAVLEPTVSFDETSLEAAVVAFAARFDRAPLDATLTRAGDGFDLRAAENGQAADPTTSLAIARSTLGRLDAPTRLDVVVPLVAVEPAITTADATFARIQADRVAQDIALVDGDETWLIERATILGWIGFLPTPEGDLEPIVGTPGVTGVLAELAPGMARKPVSATFLIGKNGAIVGVEAGVDGRALDVDATAPVIAALLRDRAAGTDPGNIAPVFAVTKPTLSTEEAEKSAPLMKKLSSWTTYFPISEKNGFGANIWIPTRDIDGYVIAPGAKFDFWKAVGPVTRERGYRDGGAIINGKTEPQGALAGGICSCSTTIFNAALRAGLEMGSRRNHYYYIDRYPIGLDATVFISSSGSVQTVSFTNDTAHPILVRGFEIKNGSKGYVRFDLYGVPDGRKVTFSKPIVKDVLKARDTTVYTSALKVGTSRRIEYPVDGKKVWVTRTVRDANGKIIHENTYYSNYARITGIVQIGTAGSKPAPAPAPTPTPAPPTPAPS